MIGSVVRRLASSIFVGRVAERAELEAAVEAAERGEPGLVLVGGEAGIGKSRLVAELFGTARGRGARVVIGRCFETNAVSLPFAPWIEVLRALATDERGGHELGRLVPEFTDPAGSDSLPADSDRSRLFHAVLDVLRRAAADRPLIVAVEDLHWADASSLDLLRFVTAELGNEAILILATFRSEAVGDEPGVRAALGELVRLPLCVRMDLRPFEMREVAEQLTGIGGRRPDDEVVERIFARSDGNPFHVEELAGRPSDAGLPATLEAVLGARLATLAPGTRRVVVAAAAIGRDVGHELLARVTAIPHDRLLTALREAIDQHVLIQADASRAADFSFRHALIQEFAYRELLPAERTAIHAKIAEALSGVGGSSAEISRHALLAGDAPLAFARAVEAADHATAALAFAEGLAHVKQAIELWDKVDPASVSTGPDKVTLLLLGARCAVAIGQWGEAVLLRRSALRELGHDRRAERAAILLDLADSLSFSADWPGAAAAVREAAELVPEQPPSAPRAWALAELANSELNEGRIDAARRLAGEAIEVARAAGAAPEEVRALVGLAQSYSVDLQFGAASELLARAAEVVAERSVTEEFVVATLISRRGEIALTTGDYLGAIEKARAGLARAARVGTIAQQRPFLRWKELTACVALGRWNDAERLVDEAEQDTTPMQYQWTVDIFLPALLRQGRLAEAEQAVQKTDRGYDTPWEGAWILQARLRLAYAMGHWSPARASADEAVALFPGEAEAFLWDILPDAVRGEADRAEAARGRRRTEEAAEARATGLGYLERLRRVLRGAIERGGAGQLVEAVLATVEAEGSRLLGRSDPELWREAARRVDELLQPWEAAYARFRQAEAMLAAREDRPAALALLRDAARVASELGATPLRSAVEGLARRGRLSLEPAGRRTGATRQATNDQGVVVALTSREREVLVLVTAGHTNREIGEALFISEKTASVHITNAMDKLGALSRYDAAASAARLGLLESESPSGVARGGARRH